MTQFSKDDPEAHLLACLLNYVEPQGDHWIWTGALDYKGHPYYHWYVPGDTRRTQTVFVRREFMRRAGWSMSHRVLCIGTCDEYELCVSPECTTLVLTSEYRILTHPVGAHLTLKELREIAPKSILGNEEW